MATKYVLFYTSAHDDPFVVGGVVSAWEVREWNEVELADLPS
jgi:hypothetical protein